MVYKDFLIVKERYEGETTYDIYGHHGFITTCKTLQEAKRKIDRSTRR